MWLNYRAQLPGILVLWVAVFTVLLWKTGSSSCAFDRWSTFVGSKLGSPWHTPFCGQDRAIKQDLWPLFWFPLGPISNWEPYLHTWSILFIALRPKRESIHFNEGAIICGVWEGIPPQFRRGLSKPECKRSLDSTANAFLASWKSSDGHQVSLFMQHLTGTVGRMQLIATWERPLETMQILSLLKGATKPGAGPHPRGPGPRAV